MRTTPHRAILSVMALAIVLAAIPSFLQADGLVDSLEIEVAPARIRQGDLMLISVYADEPLSALDGNIGSRSFSFFPGQVCGVYRAIVGAKQTLAPGTYPIDVRGIDSQGRMVESRTMARIHARNFPSETLKVARRMVSPSKKSVARIQREQALIKELTSKKSEVSVCGAFMRPVAGSVSSSFGRKRVFNGKVKTRHTGVDLRGGVGTPIKASNAGRVVLARELYIPGNTVIIDHGLGLFTIYAHLNSFAAREGAYVGRGEVIGTVGATGRVTGPHLHWGLKLAGQYFAPLSALELPLVPGAEDSSFMAASLR